MLGVVFNSRISKMVTTFANAQPMNKKTLMRKLPLLFTLGVLAVGVTTCKMTPSKAEAPARIEIPAAPAETPVASTVEEGSAAPDFNLKDVHGKTIHLADYKGKVVVLNFWATWCPPCRKEIPDFMELQSQFGSKIQFIGVALDDEGLAKVKPFVDANNISYPIVIGDKLTVDKYGDMSAIPVTFVIDKNGKIAARYVGMRQKATVETMVKPLL
jgi:peroxiredoxin